MIAALEKDRVNWAIIQNAEVDGMEERRFQVSHPVLWKYLMDRFEPVPDPRLPAEHQLLRRRQPL